jgi:hypothetical protein
MRLLARFVCPLFIVFFIFSTPYLLIPLLIIGCSPPPCPADIFNITRRVIIVKEKMTRCVKDLPGWQNLN